jgi:hypothetical protein
MLKLSIYTKILDTEIKTSKKPKILLKKLTNSAYAIFFSFYAHWLVWLRV